MSLQSATRHLTKAALCLIQKQVEFMEAREDFLHAEQVYQQEAARKGVMSMAKAKPKKGKGKGPKKSAPAIPADY